MESSRLILSSIPYLRLLANNSSPTLLYISTSSDKETTNTYPPIVVSSFFSVSGITLRFVLGSGNNNEFTRATFNSIGSLSASGIKTTSKVKFCLEHFVSLHKDILPSFIRLDNIIFSSKCSTKPTSCTLRNGFSILSLMRFFISSRIVLLCDLSNQNTTIRFSRSSPIFTSK